MCNAPTVHFRAITLVALVVGVAGCRARSTQEVNVGQEKDPFDRVIDLGAWTACVYDVDVRGVRGGVAGRALLDRTRSRVRAGRVLWPDRVHYVDVLTDGVMDEQVRTALLSELGRGDGIDSVSVSGVRFDAGPLEAAQKAEARLDLSEAGEAWSRIATATEADAPLWARVVSTGPAGVRVDVSGVEGELYRSSGEALPAVGTKLRVRVIMLNLKHRKLIVMPLSP